MLVEFAGERADRRRVPCSLFRIAFLSKSRFVTAIERVLCQWIVLCQQIGVLAFPGSERCKHDSANEPALRSPLSSSC